MGKQIKFELSYKGVGQLLRSAGMQAAMAARAARVMGAIPTEKGYESETKVIGTRAVAIVRAAGPHAKNDNLKNNTLLKGLSCAHD